MRFAFAVTYAALIWSTAAIDCSEQELKKYNFDQIKGVYKGEIARSTPPSKSVLTWAIGVCQNLDEVKDCPKNSDVCGITKVSVDSSELVTEIVGFNQNQQKTFHELSGARTGIAVTYKGVSWGDSTVDGTINFVCAKSGDSGVGELAIAKWTGLEFEADFKTPAACANGKYKAPVNEDTGESWGWFTWIFIFMVLFLSIYIIGGAWFQYNKGNSIDFQLALKEVFENTLDLLRGLPLFVKEILEKVTGNSTRGEYLAV